MQVLCYTTFGKLWLYSYNIGCIDAGGMEIVPVLCNSHTEHPYSSVWFGGR